MSWDDDTTVILSSGPVRVVTDDPGPEPPPLLGFGIDVPAEIAQGLLDLADRAIDRALEYADSVLGPLLWDGDQA